MCRTAEVGRAEKTDLLSARNIRELMEGLLSETVNHIFADKGIFMGPDPNARPQWL